MDASLAAIYLLNHNVRTLSSHELVRLPVYVPATQLLRLFSFVDNPQDHDAELDLDDVAVPVRIETDANTKKATLTNATVVTDYRHRPLEYEAFGCKPDSLEDYSLA